LGRKITPENSDNTLEKFERIDKSYREILEHCPHPSSLNAVNEMAHRLQDINENLQLTS
ncbi:unnamed protein product, partial [Rotaria sp. Silwood2]